MASEQINNKITKISGLIPKCCIFLFFVLIGYLVYLQVYGVAILFPTYTFLVNNYVVEDQYVGWRAYRSIFLAYCGAMLPFLPTAIRDFSNAPMSLAVIMASSVIALNAVPFLIPTLAFAFLGHRLKYYLISLAAAITCAMIPNFGNLNFGDLAIQYNVFQPAGRILGVSGLTVLVCLFQAVLVEAIYSKKANRAALTVFFLCLFVFLTGYFDEKINPRQFRQKQFRLLAVQPQVPQRSERFEKNETTFSRNLQNSISMIVQQKDFKSDLIIFPESGFPMVPQFYWPDNQLHRKPDNVFSSLDVLIQQTNSSVLLEQFALQVHPYGGLVAGALPTMLLYETPGANLTHAIHKRHLVPFLETVPGFEKFPILAEFFPWARSMSFERTNEPLEINGVYVKPMICYDSLFQDSFLDENLDQTDLFVSLTNNFYLKNGSHFQWAITHSRVIESGRPLVYVGNYTDTGLISAEKIIRTGSEAPRVVPIEFTSIEVINTFYSRKLYPFLNSIPVEFRFAIAVILFFFVLFNFVKKQVSLNRQQTVQSLKNFLIYSSVVLVSVGIYFYATNFGFQIIVVPTNSMEPEILSQSKELVCRFNREPRRGDIISAHFGYSTESVVKRVIVLPGEELTGRGSIKNSLTGLEIPIKYEERSDGTCFESIDNDQWQIPCNAKGSLSSLKQEQLGHGQYLIMGDNRNHSDDSRKYGPISKESISGVLCLH